MSNEQHTFVLDTNISYVGQGADFCSVCGMPRKHPVHSQPDHIPHLGLILKIIRLGLTGRQDGVKAYTELLADHVEESGDERTAAILRQYSRGEFGVEVREM